MATKKTSAAVTVGIMTLFMISLGVSYMQPLMARVAEFYPGVDPGSLSYLMSMAFLGTLVGALLGGALVPRVMGYKPAGIIGTILFCVFGVLPVWIHGTLGIMIAFRFLLGVGCGFMTPLTNGLTTAFYEGDARAKILSVGSAVTQIGSMLMQLMAGAFGDMYFWYAFFAPGLSIISVIGALFLIKEPEKPAVEEKKEKGSIKDLGGSVWYCAIIALVATLALMPLLFNYSFFVGEITDSLTVSATVQMSFTIGSIVGGLIYVFLLKGFKRRVSGISCVIYVIGAVGFLTVAKTIPLMYVFKFIAGVGYSSLLPGLLNIIGFSVKPELVSLASGVYFIFMNISSFLASPMISLVAGISGDGIATPIWVGIVIMVVCALLLLIKPAFPKDITPFLEKADSKN